MTEQRWQRVADIFVVRNAGERQFAHSYVTSRDGQRFLVNTIVETADAPVTVVLNWSPGDA